ncbi:interleukin-15 receptor subunit alpha isoform X2 [Numida meleagris]|uniref:interleukin-15 receptor subunit alpha isoform X2 n=1 Tax=Numida meleagris TaxID=8996 RepID=UPI000B3DC747|nr:interleukin-15 receptor subunit alpha isoform X2 [Numida meleagris]
MELKCLLMWLLLGSIMGTRAEKCPSLPSNEFADVAAETYPLKTKLRYVCDSGYKRRSGNSLTIRCQNISGTASWVYDELVCIAEKPSFSRNQTAKLNSTPEPARETQSSAPSKQEKISSFCGMPKTVPHTSLSAQQQYSVGQVLHFKCPTGYNKQLPESGTITCKNVNGIIKWMPLDTPCTNDSSPINKQLSHLIEAVIFFILLLHSAVFV